MRERSVPVNFTVESLEKPLGERRVKATIRSRGYIRKHGLKPGEKIEVKYRRKRVGFAVIIKVRRMSYDDLYNPEVFQKAGFTSADELIKVVKGFFSWQWRRIKAGKQKMYFIEFRWI
ncbi:MAG TPA: hypothetical protein ENI45_03735 [Thermoplasmatales archaeon]|nr:hypothetical protein [Thermoplasmatales archaeon]